MPSCAPIVLFAYDRPDHIRRTLTALRRNTLAGTSSLHVFCDGPADDAAAEDFDRIHEVRAIVRSEQWCGDVVIHERESNSGLAKSIREGIVWIFERSDRAIILEDDIETSPGFLQYMNDALRAYADSPEVMHINGYLPAASHRGFLPETFFARAMSCWGWATWRESWQRANWDAASLLARLDASPQGRRHFDLDGAAPFSIQLERNLSGQLRTWAIFWAASIYLEGGLCLTPGKSLAANIGTDGSGVHFQTDRSAVYDTPLTDSVDVVRKSPRESRIGRWYLRSFYRYGNDSRLARRARLRLGNAKHRVASILGRVDERAGQ